MSWSESLLYALNLKKKSAETRISALTAWLTGL